MRLKKCFDILQVKKKDICQKTFYSKREHSDGDTGVYKIAVLYIIARRMI